MYKHLTEIRERNSGDAGLDCLYISFLWLVEKTRAPSSTNQMQNYCVTAATPLLPDIDLL